MDTNDKNEMSPAERRHRAAARKRRQEEMKRRKCRRALLFVVMILIVAVIAGGIIVAVSKFTGGGSGVKISAQGSTYVIAIDPGHGGRDTGMSSAAIEEKEADLNICAKLKIMLESQGYQVVMTREDDSYLSKDCLLYTSRMI